MMKQGNYQNNAGLGFRYPPSKKRILRMIPRIGLVRVQTKWQLKAALFGLALLSTVMLLSFTTRSSSAHRRLTRKNGQNSKPALQKGQSSLLAEQLFDTEEMKEMRLAMKSQDLSKGPRSPMENEETMDHIRALSSMTLHRTPSTSKIPRTQAARPFILNEENGSDALIQAHNKESDASLQAAAKEMGAEMIINFFSTLVPKTPRIFATKKELRLIVDFTKEASNKCQLLLPQGAEVCVSPVRSRVVKRNKTVWLWVGYKPMKGPMQYAMVPAAKIYGESFKITQYLEDLRPGDVPTPCEPMVKVKGEVKLEHRQVKNESTTE